MLQKTKAPEEGTLLMKNSWLLKLLAMLRALTVVAAACGSDSDDEGAAADDSADWVAILKSYEGTVQSRRAEQPG